MKNATIGKEWTSIDLKWKAPEKYPAGKITIRYSGPQTQPVYGLRRIITRKINLTISSSRNLTVRTASGTELKKSSSVSCHHNEMYTTLISKLTVQKRTDVIFKPQQQQQQK